VSGIKVNEDNDREIWLILRIWSGYVMHYSSILEDNYCSPLHQCCSALVFLMVTEQNTERLQKATPVCSEKESKDGKCYHGIVVTCICSHFRAQYIMHIHILHLDPAGHTAIQGAHNVVRNRSLSWITQVIEKWRVEFYCLS
jgi:hypothetical protein